MVCLPLLLLLCCQFAASQNDPAQQKVFSGTLPAPAFKIEIAGEITHNYSVVLTPEKASNNPNSSSVLTLNYMDHFRLGFEMATPVFDPSYTVVSWKWVFQWDWNGNEIAGFFKDCFVRPGISECEATECWTEENNFNQNPFSPIVVATTTGIWGVTAHLEAVVDQPSTGTTGQTVLSASAISQIIVSVADAVYIDATLASRNISFVDTNKQLGMIQGAVGWLYSTPNDDRFPAVQPFLKFEVHLCNSTSCNKIGVVPLSKVGTNIALSYVIDTATNIETHNQTMFGIRVTYDDAFHASHFTAQPLVFFLFFDDQETPGSAITSVSVQPFVDVDYDPGQIGGLVTFSRVAGDSPPDYLGYRLYLALSSSSNDRIGLPIASVSISELGTSASATMMVLNNTALESTMVLQIVPYNHGGNSEYCAVIFPSDKSTPTDVAGQVSFTDLELTVGNIRGSIVFQRSPTDVLSNYYYIYWANGLEKQDRIGSPIAQISIADLQAKGLTYGLFALGVSSVIGSHFQVVLVNSLGISNYANGTQIRDRAVPTNSDATEFEASPSFFDTDLAIDFVTGNLTFTPTHNEISGWRIYLATSTTVASRTSLLQTALKSSAKPLNSSHFLYTIQLNHQSVANYASKIHLVPFNGDGDSGFFSYFALVDRAVPGTVVSDVVASDMCKEQGKVCLDVTFTRPYASESTLRPAVTGYSIFLGRNNSGLVTWDSVAVANVTVTSLDVLGSLQRRVTVPLSRFAMTDRNVLAVSAYGSGYTLAQVSATTSFKDTAVPTNSTVATNLTFEDHEAYAGYISGPVSFDVPCSFSTTWQLFLGDGSAIANKTTGLVDQTLYQRNQTFVAQTGALGTLLASWNTTASNCTSQQLATTLGAGSESESGLAVAASQRNLLVIASNVDGECYYAAEAQFKDLAAPSVTPSNVLFVDTNLRYGLVGGILQFSRCTDESNVLGYSVWLADGYSRADRQNGTELFVATISELGSGATVQFTVPDFQMEPNRDHVFQVFAFNEDGEGSLLAVDARDRALPFVKPQDLAFLDNNVLEGKLSGEFTFTGVPSPSLANQDYGLTTGYRLYVASGPELADRKQQLDDITKCSCDGKYSIFEIFDSTAGWFHLVAYGENGEGEFTAYEYNDVVGLSAVAAAAATTAAVAATAAAGASSGAASGASGASGAANASGSSSSASGLSPWGMVSNFQATGANSQTSSNFPPEYRGFADSMQWANGDISVASMPSPEYSAQELSDIGADVIAGGRTPEEYFLQMLLLCFVLVALDLLVLGILWCVGQRRLEKRILNEYADSKPIETADASARLAKQHEAEVQRKRKEQLKQEKQRAKAPHKPPKPAAPKTPKRWLFSSFLVRIFLVMYYSILTASLFQVRSGKNSAITGVALVVLLVVGLGLPLANIMVLLFRNMTKKKFKAQDVAKSRVFHNKLSAVCQPMLKDFKAGKKWFHIVGIVRKVCLSTCVVFLVGFAHGQASMLLITFCLYFALLFVDPFNGSWSVDCRMEIVMTFLNLYALSVAVFVPPHVQAAHSEIGMSLVIGQMLGIVVFCAVSFYKLREVLILKLKEREANLREEAKYKAEQKKKKIHQMMIAENDSSSDNDADPPPLVARLNSETFIAEVELAGATSPHSNRMIFSDRTYTTASSFPSRTQLAHYMAEPIENSDFCDTDLLEGVTVEPAS